MEKIYAEKASIGKRFIAILLDGIILGVIGYLIFGGGHSYTIPRIGMSIGPMLLSAVYFILQEGGAKGATLGKRVMNIRVVSSNDDPMDYSKAAIRFGGKLLSALVLMIGYIIALFRDDNAALHDILAKTEVVEE